MRVYKKLASIGLLTFFVSVLIFAAKPERPISLQVENLTHWKNSPEASAIQKSLGAILNPHRKYQSTTENFKALRQYASIFRKPFLLLDAESNDFGGFFALVVFKSYTKVLRLWIYEIDKNGFEIREVLPLQVTLNKKIMNELADKRILPFWQTFFESRRSKLRAPR